MTKIPVFAIYVDLFRKRIDENGFEKIDLDELLYIAIDSEEAEKVKGGLIIEYVSRLPDSSKISHLKTKGNDSYFIHTGSMAIYKAVAKIKNGYFSYS